MGKPHKWAKEIKAWADGETVEFRCTPFAPWDVMNHDCGGFNEECEYRIKTEPREWWLVPNNTGYMTDVYTHRPSFKDKEIIHVREVLDEKP